MFAPGSRYATVPRAVYTDPSGRAISYRQLRRIPTGIASQGIYVVVDRDRFDWVANAAYGDPLLFWRICDANRGMWPADLLSVPGSFLDIPEQP